MYAYPKYLIFTEDFNNLYRMNNIYLPLKNNYEKQMNSETYLKLIYVLSPVLRGKKDDHRVYKII